MEERVGIARGAKVCEPNSGLPLRLRLGCAQVTFYSFKRSNVIHKLKWREDRKRFGEQDERVRYSITHFQEQRRVTFYSFKDRNAKNERMKRGQAMVREHGAPSRAKIAFERAE